MREVLLDVRSRLACGPGLVLKSYRCLGQQNGIIQALLACQKVDVSEDRFEAARAEQERLPKGKISLLEHALFFVTALGILSAPGVKPANG